MREQVREAVFENLGKREDFDGKGARPLHDYPGRLLYSRWSTVQQGQLYVMGLNPGGRPDEIPASIVQSLQDDRCEYEEDWQHGPGQHPIQRVANEIIKVLIGPERLCDVFSTNAIFLRSQNDRGLPFPRLWAGHCWPIHQLLLSVVRPRVIVCLGNGERLSAFSLLRKQCAAPVTEFCSSGAEGVYRNGKWFRARLQTNPGRVHECLVVGVPHPSYVSALSPELRGFLERIRAQEP